MTPAKFVDAIAALRFESVFNPYSDRCPVYDLPHGPEQRRRNLRSQLEVALDVGVDSIWLGRDLGYRGGRRTGIALTDEPNLANLSTCFSKTVQVARATRGPQVAERTAAVVWRVIKELEVCVFTWNVFPLHPHKYGEPLSNRCHTKAERLATRSLLLELVQMLRPHRVVAIGNDAEAGLADLGIGCERVRHPSYGGISEFESGMYMLHGRVGPKRIEPRSLSLI